MTYKKNIGLGHARVGQPEPAAVMHQRRTTHAPAHLITHAVAEGRTHRHHNHQHVQVKQALRRQKSGQQNQAFAGNKQAQKSR